VRRRERRRTLHRALNHSGLLHTLDFHDGRPARPTLPREDEVVAAVEAKLSANRQAPRD
jgi:hypothetical protein